MIYFTLKILYLHIEILTQSIAGVINNFLILAVKQLRLLTL